MQGSYLELAAPIFNIQSYSIHDGPGIRVTVFLKGCPLRCLWCANPESNLARPQLMTYGNKCTACGACIPACPNGAISLSEGSGKRREFTDRSLCADCGACVNVCRAGARELAGRAMTVKEVLEKVEQDRLFMEDSGGGMTLSGGECLTHPEFSEALLHAARLRGIHTAVESCSFASHSVIDRVFRNVDLALLDVKHMDSQKHLEYTAVPNEQILDNIRYIYHELKVPVWIRVPVIPGYNDDEANIAATAKFVSEELGADVEVHLLPYHRLGESKNESMGKGMDFSIEIPDKQHMEHLKGIVESYGLKSQIGG